ncbi:MAG: alpha/beta hydrolase [Actinobacteria bacterium]|nr:alpha/beta hydrolase [Actinomycetota bacterium]
MGSASVAWKLIETQLSQSLNVVTIDLPGHGKTPFNTTQAMDPVSLADSVLETMASLGIQKFHIVGNSLGGWIALEIAAAKPEAVQSVTALAPAGLWLKPFDTRYPGTAIARMLANSLRVVSPLLLRYEWARKIGFENVSPLWRSFSYELCLDASNALASATGYLPAWDALLKKRFDKTIDGSIKVTVIFGDSDRTLPESTCQEKSLLPNHAKWLVIPECGHAPMWDHPKEVVEQILETAGIQT